MTDGREISFDVVGSVVKNTDGTNYLVRFDDGAELMAVNKSNEPVDEGARVGLRAVSGGWEMYVL